MSDLFVVNRNVHLILRAAAVFILSPVLLYKGFVYKDRLLLIFGLLVLAIDSYTLYKSIATDI